MTLLPRPAICLVTAGTAGEAAAEGADALVRGVAQAARCGVNLVQIREPVLGDRALLTLARRLLDEVDRATTLIVVNERTDLALASDADGVHLRADAMLPSRVRAILPDGFLVGRSVHSVEEAVDADADGGADYLMFGTVFSSARKPKDHPVAGLAALRRVCTSVRLPVIAIGGIDVERVPEIALAGAAGIAAIGMFADIPGNDANRLRKVVQDVQDAFSR